MSKPVFNRLALACVTFAASLTAQATDLKTVFGQALENDPQLAAELASADANAQTGNIARGAILPQISFSAEQSTTTLDGGAIDSSVFNGTTNTIETVRVNDPLDNKSYDKTSYSISASQALLNANSWYTYASASATTDQAGLERIKAEQDVVVRLAEAYFDVLRSTATLAAAKAQEAAVKRQLEQTQQRFKVGLIAITEVHEAQAIYDGATVELIAAESELDIAYEALALLTGERYHHINPLKDEIPLTGPVPADRAHWEQLALTNNIDVLIANKGQSAARLNHKAKLADHAPTIDLVGQYSITEDEGNSVSLGEELTTTYVGLQLEVPLFAGGSQYATHKQAYYQRQAAEKQLEAAQRSASLQVRSYYRQLQADVARIKARKQAITSARSAMEATQTGYEVGTRNIVEVLNAQLDVFSAEEDYAHARYDYVIDLLKFRQAVGELTIKDIEEVNAWLQS